MYLIPFYIVDAELAVEETRVITLLVSQKKLPAGAYGLLEFYCPDPGCDCRRVMLNVAEEKNPSRFLAAISYGFDRDEEDAGPFLDPLNPQSEYAEELLRLVEETVLNDPRYVARLEQHYHLVKQAASDPDHPTYDRLQKTLADDADSFPVPQPAHRRRRRSRKRKPQRKRRKRRTTRIDTVGKTNKERILDYLWTIAPDYATNGQIREATGIRSHQQVYLLTRELMHTGRIRGEQRGREWVFWADESLAVQFTSPGRAPRHKVAAQTGKRLSSRAFEDLARTVLGKHFGVPLAPGQVPGVPKEWDMVSLDGDIIGDAKYFTLVQGQRLPPAKFSIIAEHVWLLEKTGALTTFLVFGHDRQVAELWLQRYGKLVSSVDFYFLADDGTLELLQENVDGQKEAA